MPMLAKSQPLKKNYGLPILPCKLYCCRKQNKILKLFHKVRYEPVLKIYIFSSIKEVNSETNKREKGESLDQCSICDRTELKRRFLGRAADAGSMIVYLLLG